MDRPNFAIGFQWDFSPHSEIWKADLFKQLNVVDFVCLPVEASLLYGGPMSDLIGQVSSSYQVALKASWSKIPPQAKWDTVYRDSLATLCERLDPGTIYFENFRPKLTELSLFESEMTKLTDAHPVLNLPLQWHGNELLWDELWIKELLKKTKMQVCLRLDQFFEGTLQTSFNSRLEKLLRLLSLFESHRHRLSEIRIPVSELDQLQWKHEIEAWKMICFDEARSSSVVFVWREPAGTLNQLRSCLTLAHSYRLGVDKVIPFKQHHTSEESSSDWRNVFESVFPRLVQTVGWENLLPSIQKFLATLDQEEWDPHETLRRWPMFLKVTGDPEKLDWIDLSLFDWAQFSAQFHPAEEIHEQRSLRPQEIKVNPTIQIVRQKQQMSAVYRMRQSGNNNVLSRELSWYEAAILDELQESAKSEITHLVNHLIHVISPQNKKLDRSTWLKHISDMAKNGLILYSQVE